MTGDPVFECRAEARADRPVGVVAGFPLAKPKTIAYSFSPVGGLALLATIPFAEARQQRIGAPQITSESGAVAQLGECLTGSQEVTSSILVSSTNKINNLRAFPPSPHLHFSPTFAVYLPFGCRESTS